MKTANVNKETLLVKGSVQREKKANLGQTKPKEWTTGQWLVQKQTIKARSQSNVKNRREDFGWGNAIPLLKENEQPQQQRSRTKNCLALKCVLTRRIVFPIYETHETMQQRCCALENALSPFFPPAKWKSRLFIVDGDWNWWRQNTFQTEYTITTMNNINLIWNSALDRAKNGDI